MARVQTKTNVTNSAASLAVTFDAAPTVGNTIVVVAAMSQGAAGADPNTGDTVEWMAFLYFGTGPTQLAIYIGHVYATPSASFTVYPVAASAIALAGAEYEGLWIPDRQKVASGTSTTAASGATGTTTVANELWIGGIAGRVANGPTYSAPTNGFAIAAQAHTTLGTTSDKGAALLDQYVSATGTANAGATLESAVWVAAALALKPVTASGAVVNLGRRIIGPRGLS